MSSPERLFTTWAHDVKMTQLRRRNLIVGEQYRMTDYYASDSPLAQGIIVTVINRKGEIRIGDSMLRGGLGIVVVITAELVEAAKAALLAGAQATAPPEYVVPIKSLERL